MTPQQRAVIAAAQKDNLLPMEIGAELLVHDLMACLLDQLRKRQVAFAKLSEREQDSAISEIQAEVKKAVTVAARVITAQGKETVGAKLKSLKIDGKLTATMIIEGDEPNRHILTDKAHDKSDILIVLYPNGYSEGLSAHQAEKDQKSLPLDDDEKPNKPRASKPKAEDKPVELPPRLIEDGRAFIIKQQTPNMPALQNFLKINFSRAEALLKLFEEEGLITFMGDDGNGQYEMVRSSSATNVIKTIRYLETDEYVTTTDGSDPFEGLDDPNDWVWIQGGPKIELDKETAEVFYATAVKAVIKAASADDSVLRPIYGDDDNAIEVALMRMEDDGIVSPPSPEGLRDVLTLP